MRLLLWSKCTTMTNVETRQWIHMGQNPWQSIQPDERTHDRSPCTCILWPWERTEAPDGCFKMWPWCSRAPRRQTNCLCIQVTQQHWRELCTNRSKRCVCSTVWLQVFSWGHVRPESDWGIRPQTAWGDTLEAVGSSATVAAKNDITAITTSTFSTAPVKKSQWLTHCHQNLSTTMMTAWWSVWKSKYTPSAVASQ